MAARKSIVIRTRYPDDEPKEVPDYYLVVRLDAEPPFVQLPDGPATLTPAAAKRLATFAKRGKAQAPRPSPQLLTPAAANRLATFARRGKAQNNGLACAQNDDARPIWQRWCRDAEQLPGSRFWRVVVSWSSGTRFTAYWRFYDPNAASYVGPVGRFSWANLSPNGRSAMTHHGIGKLGDDKLAAPHVYVGAYWLEGGTWLPLRTAEKSEAANE